MSIINPGFEAGDTGWVKGADWTIVNNSGFSRDGTWAARWDGGNGTNSEIINNVREPVAPGQSISASLYGSTNGAGSSQGGVHVILVWYNSSNARIGDTSGTIISGGGTSMRQSTVNGTAPSGAATVSIGARAYRNSNPRPYFVDTATWSIVRDRTIELIQPTDGQEFSVEQQIPLRVNVGGSAPAITSVSYLVDGVAERVSTAPPYGVNLSPLAAGSYTLQARLDLVDGTTVLSNEIDITVVTVPTPPTLREYKASNSYTYLIGENFIGLGGAMPPTARVLGVEVLVDYTLEVLVRSKDLGIADPAEANPDVAFDIVDGGTVEAVLLTNNGTSYTQLGAAMSNTIPINRVDFEIDEDGTSEGKRWTVFTGGEGQVVIGAEDQRFGLLPEFGSTFIDYGVGIRFTPNLGSVPTYAEAGDAAYRFNVQAFKVRVYFDAGSVEYYFASADKTEVLKGTLAAYYVYTGNFATSDASGVLQLTADLEQMDGTQRWIGSDWTIHSSYPPTDNNQIGQVGEIEEESELGMKYNGLPTQRQIAYNRSRYEIKTENFYGSTDLNSMYGVHGLARAFAYNGDFFYKIYTQADPEKDSPRHVANHHGHLALGYNGGRVDISVAGEPYNFRGVDGASSWAFGDKVVGLLPLSGTILGVFGAKSVWGISGTTVDNFATQVISPNMGAVEYTITDMGFPVYANSYGIYTLNQTQQYGDYLGQPMSQDISPWLRPRLIRKVTADKEVVCAFPVRSKNQYRLCFSDGYVTSMTLNGQQVPTFSFQRYYYTPEGVELPDDLFSYPSIVPAAISSELDESGEERIHMAEFDATSINLPPILGPLISGDAPDTYLSSTYSYQYNLTPRTYDIVEVSADTLPPGLSLSNTGLLSGTPSSTGVYSFRITVVDADGMSSYIDDVIEVSGVWALARVSDTIDSTIWLSANPLSWTDQKQLSPIVTSKGFGSTLIAPNTLGYINSSTGSGMKATLPTVGNLVPTQALATGIQTNRIRRFGNLLFAFSYGSTYAYSEDDGATWTTVTVPDGRRIADIARLASGRWVTYLQLNASYGFAYSDQDIPTVWQNSASLECYADSAIACDGTTLVAVGTARRFYRSTDGANWTTLGGGVGPDITEGRSCLFSEGVIVFTSQGNNSLSISRDLGETWTNVTLSALTATQNIHKLDSTWVASGEGQVSPGNTLVYVSTDLGFTWLPSTLPFIIGSGTSVVAIPVTTEV